MSTLNSPEEVELAERLCQIHPWAQQTRFARTGGEIAALAVLEKMQRANVVKHIDKIGKKVINL